VDTRLHAIQDAADFISEQITTSPTIGLILGSGLGTLADEVRDAVVLEYRTIPGFPVSTVEGHAGRLVVGRLEDRPVVVMKGRFHYYEGYSMNQVAFPVRVMRLLGVSRLIVTNAAGGINESFTPGDLMVITDHIKLFSDSPLRGPNLDRFGPRFNDMSDAYTASLRVVARNAAAEVGLELKEGVYAHMAGPSFETPAEIRMLRVLGADAVGMSTVPEAIAAVHAGIQVLGISAISNMAAGMLDQPLNHREVMETGKMVQGRFSRLICAVLRMMEEE
jgi:purine-nucleoside phosphorylase